MASPWIHGWLIFVLAASTALSSPAQDRAAADGSERLPWEKTRGRASPLPLSPVQGPREFLSRYGITDSQWDGFFAGQPLSPAEEEVLVRLIHLYPRMGQENVERWAVRDLAWDELAAAAKDHRGKIIPVRGRAQRVTKIELLPEVATRYEFAHCYRVQMRLEEEPFSAEVYCLDLPAAWQVDAELDEPAAALGLFLKVGDAPQDIPKLLFAARRIAWFPDRPQPKLGIDQADVALAKAGVDIGRFAEVGKEKALGLLSADREPFYQILSALGDERANALLASVEREFDVAQVLQQPERLQGHALPVRGIARRVARIEVPDPDIRQRFGIDHYYEVDLTLPLKQKIRLGTDPKKKSAGVVYENSFPATICLRSLPADLPLGDDLHEPVEANALLFKIWLYQSPYAAEAKLAQPAPLLLARDVRVVREQPASSLVSDLLVGGALLAALLSFVGIILYFKFSDRTAAGRAAAAPSVPPPDFSSLK